VKARTQAELSARKNATMKRFVDRLQRETKVRYEPGYAPGS
jgi:transposase